HRHPPRSLSPAAKPGAAAKPISLLLCTHGPFPRTILAGATCPGIADEPVDARRRDMHHTLLVAQTEDTAILAHQQIRRPPRPQEQRDSHDRHPGQPPAATPQAAP